MIASHLETMYPDYNIQLVAIKAEEAYGPELVRRLRAYGSSDTPTRDVAHAVTVDLTQPGTHQSDPPPSSLISSQSSPSHRIPPPPRRRSNPSPRFSRPFPLHPTHTYSQTSSPRFSISPLPTCPIYCTSSSGKHRRDRHRISLPVQR